jgi:hypothetical protein
MSRNIISALMYYRHKRLDLMMKCTVSEERMLSISSAGEQTKLFSCLT